MRREVSGASGLLGWQHIACFFLHTRDMVIDLDGVCLRFVYISFVYLGIQYLVHFLLFRVGLACCLRCVCGGGVVMLKKTYIRQNTDPSWAFCRR